ncbi:peptide ABC transporter permease [Microvirga antarctica]|uniref:peptide ABC transporter permease n=1 Tax=Microvirga antarctica TaxID=2819233 RepID=UPI001B314693|nr:peptide ABC transporter permease [Microvirga antarctica]
MARSPTLTANPSADAAAMLRRLGFALLFFVIPVTALFARRAVVIVAPFAVVLLLLAVFLDGGSKAPANRLMTVIRSPAGVAGGVLLFWAALSLLWTPFVPEASERLLNIFGMCAMALVGYLAIPARMRSANLYILPVGVGMAALMGMIAVFREGSGLDPGGQSLDRGMIVLVLLLWPAITWLHSRGRNLEALLLAVVVALGSLFARDALALQALSVGVLAFVLTALLPGTGARLTGIAMAGLLLFAPLLPFLLKPLLIGVLGPQAAAVASVDVWRTLILEEPHRLITGHGLETALRGRFFGLLPANAPFSFLFEIWYELGLVGAGAAATILYSAASRAGGDRPVLGPGIMAAFATAYALGCLGIGTAQIWWFATLVVMVLIFVAIDRGQFRTTRPKAILRPVH